MTHTRPPRSRVRKEPTQADDTLETMRARLATSPCLQAAATINRYEHAVGGHALPALVEALKDRMTEVHDDNLQPLESMLFAQATTLDVIFNRLATLAHSNLTHLDHFERLLRLGLKAQSQSRSTLETLGKLKMPQPVALIKQANIAAGPQQINNTQQKHHPHSPVNVPSAGSRVRNTKKSQNKLLEQAHGERLDTRTTTTAIRTHQDVAALDTIIRPKVGCR